MATEIKPSADLLNEIAKDHPMKHVETQEKNSLPSVTAISQEKTVQAISGFDKTNLKKTEVDEKSGWKEACRHENAVSEMGNFDKTQLKHTSTEEKNPLPDASAIKAEKQEVEHRKGIDDFDKRQLRRSLTEEKILLPSKEAISQERQEMELRNSIERSNRSSLKKVETNEKDGLKEIVAQEKTHKIIESFSKEQLKHAETQEKNPLPTKEDIQAEKSAK